MSRSNPTDNQPHPCTKWIDWAGGEDAGFWKYYDKEEKRDVSLGDAITFIPLDRTSTIKGFHEKTQSGIYSNEIRDIKQDVLVVKAHKGGTLAEGTYAQIKDRVKVQGGSFATVLYVAMKFDGVLSIASICFKGASLRPWMDFESKNRSELYKKAVTIKGYVDAKKGRTNYRHPETFALREVSPETDARAIELDKVLQAFLTTYFGRTRADAAKPADHVSEDIGSNEPPLPEESLAIDDDDIPF